LLAHYPLALAVATDLSAAALGYARRNAAAMQAADRILLVRTDLMRGVGGPFDLIVSNPPYIPTAEIERLEPEVRQWEPRGALDGGHDGLAVYLTLLPQLPALLASGGTAIVEIGQGQDPAVAAIARAVGLTPMPHRDLCGIVRCLELAPRDR
jgi:release factor glutamine methyltransferase